MMFHVEHRKKHIKTKIILETKETKGKDKPAKARRQHD